MAHVSMVEVPVEVLQVSE
jgi:hypothetical protein